VGGSSSTCPRPTWAATLPTRARARPRALTTSPFFCDDIEKTVAELKARGVEFTEPITDRGYGLVTHFKMPGNFAVQLYQPRYTKKAAGRCGLEEQE
jgi:hypothetical protein